MNARRPLVAPALGFVVGVALGLNGVPLPAAALPIAAVLSVSPVLAPAGFACAGWALARAAEAPKLPATTTASREVRGRIVSVPERAGDRVRFRLRTASGELLDAASGPSAWPLALGDEVRFAAELRAPDGPRNPGGRDVAGRLRASGVALQALAVGPVVRVRSPSPLAPLERARERLATAASRFLPPREAALLRAIATGDRSAIDAETTVSFARSGLAHVLAVSGLHLVVVAFGLERLLRGALLRVDAIAARLDPRRVSAAAVLPAAVVYAVATGAGVPVLRAVIAAGVALVAVLLDREADALNVLALAALALLAADPGAALDVSLQLSFAAVGGLALWAGPIRRVIPLAVPRPGSWRARIVEPFAAGAAATLAASVATAPVLAFHFRQVPLLGVAANVAGVPVGSALTVLGALASLAAAVSPPLAAPFLLVARPFASALLALSDAAAGPAWSVVGIGSPGLLGVAGFFAAALLAGRLRTAARTVAWAGAAAFLLVPAPLRALAARARGGLEVTFISVGQGDAALLRLPDGSAVLVDAGGAADGGADPGARDVVPLLRDLGVRRLAAVFLSHPHPDHALGLAAVAAAFPVDLAFSNGDPGGGAAHDVVSALDPIALLPGDGWARAGVRFDVRGGARDALAENDASLVLRVEYGRTSFLFPGDLEEAGEAAAVAAGGLGADVVKVPHHGSRRSSTAPFAAAVSPRLAVVSLARRNRYGFPHEEALSRWRAVGADVARTDEGAVRLLSDGLAVRRVPADSALDALAIVKERP